MKPMPKGYMQLLILCMISLSVLPVAGQSFQNTKLSGWEESMDAAEKEPDRANINRLLEWTNAALLNYFNGKKKEDAEIFTALLDETEKLSTRIHDPEIYNQGLLLKSRYYFIRNKDSLGSALHGSAIGYFTHADDSAIAPAFYFLSNAWKYRTNRFETLVADSIYFQRAARYYDQRGDQLRAISLERAIAQLDILASHPDVAIAKLKKILGLQLKINDRSRHKTTDLLAHCFAVTGSYKEGLDYAFASLSYAMEIKDSLDFGVYEMRLGRILRDIHDTARSTIYFNLALQDFKKQRDDYAALDVELNVNRMVYADQGRNQEALNNLLRLREQYDAVFRENYYLNVFIATEIGEEYVVLKNYPKAEKYFLEAIENTSRNQVVENNREPLYNDLGVLYLKEGKLEKATQYLNKTLAFAHQTNSLPLISYIESKLFQIDSIKGNYLGALQHYRRSKDMEDSMFNQAKSKQESELNIKYETVQRQKENLILNERNKLQEIDIRQSKFERKAMIVGGCMLILILFFVFNQYRIKNRSNQELKEKQFEINQKNTVLENMVDEEKILLKDKDQLLEEKEWLMKEIHHRVKNNLQIVMSLLNSQTAYLTDATALEAIKESHSRVHAISLIHQQLYQTDNLSMTNMEIYINELSEYLADTLDTKRRINIRTFSEPIELDVAQVVPLGLIINEAVTNAIKYAFPGGDLGRIDIHFKRNLSGSVTLSIHDNGTGLRMGFDWKQSQSLGISLMRGLCKQLDGHFEMTSDNGVLVRIEFLPVSETLRAQVV
jgi:two-component system, sensor histidine kinase PdtaS